MTEELPPGTPAAQYDAQVLAPVWDAHGRRWSYVADVGGYVCDDPDYPTPSATDVGAIPDQPTYAHPPQES